MTGPTDSGDAPVMGNPLFAAALNAGKTALAAAMAARVMADYAAAMGVAPVAAPLLAVAGGGCDEAALLRAALPALQAAAEAEPSDFRAHYFIGLIHARFGETAAALAAFRRSAAWCSDNAMPFFRMAEILDAAGRTDESLPCWRAAVAAAAGFNQARQALADRLRPDNPRAAAAHYLAMPPYRPEFLYYGATFAEAMIERQEKLRRAGTAPTATVEAAFLADAWRRAEAMAPPPPARDDDPYVLTEGYAGWDILRWRDHFFATRQRHRPDFAAVAAAPGANGRFHLPRTWRKNVIMKNSYGEVIAAIDRRRANAARPAASRPPLANAFTALHIITAVWDEWHTTAFLAVNLPSLLADGNLPRLAARARISYYICTTPEDAARMRRSPSYRALRRLVTVRFICLERETFGQPVLTHVRIWKTGVERARRAGACLAINPADMAWADGAFGYLGDCLAAGKKAVYAGLVRVVSETFRQEFPDREGEPLSIPPRALAAATFRHFHPLMAAYQNDSAHASAHAEWFYWPAPGEGLILRLLANTIYCVDPRAYRVDSLFSLEEIHDDDDIAYIDDSDHFFGVSLTPLMKDVDWYFMARRLPPEDVAAWWLSHDGVTITPLSRTRFHIHAGDLSSPAWRRAELESDFRVNQYAIARELLRFARFFKGVGLAGAAECLAVAFYGDRLRRRWRWRGPVTVFCPTEAAFARLSPETRTALLSADGAPRLFALIQAHVVDHPIDPPIGQPIGPPAAGAPSTEQRCAALDGSCLTIAFDNGRMTVNGAPTRIRHPLPHGHRVYEIDDFLADPTAAALWSGGSSAGDARPVNTEQRP